MRQTKVPGHKRPLQNRHSGYRGAGKTISGKDFYNLIHVSGTARAVTVRLAFPADKQRKMSNYDSPAPAASNPYPLTD
jgi:hypothetical protein